MKYSSLFVLFLITVILFDVSCNKKETTSPPGILQLVQVKIGTIVLDITQITDDIPIDSSIIIDFTGELDPAAVGNNVILTKSDNTRITCGIIIFNNSRSIKMVPVKPLDHNSTYKLQITSGIKGSRGETFTGVEYSFITVKGKMYLKNIILNQQGFLPPVKLRDIDWHSIQIIADFSLPLDPSNYQSFFTISPAVPLAFALSDSNKKVTISNVSDLNGYKKYYFTISSNLTAQNGFTFDGFINSFYTALDSTLKFPLIPDDQLLTLVQQQTFRYFYDFAHPSCGLARERNTSGDIVTIGGSGFGIMALVVGMDRGFITRSQGLERLNKILGFLETCDRYHGAWPHWLNGSTGKTVPFTLKDDGADLVETSYMVEGLITMRHYLDSTVTAEKNLINRIDALTDSVEYDWFTRGQNVLYWHWSPNYGWAMNMKIQGYNETLITYVVAASSTTHPVSANVYHQGYARNGNIRNGNSYYGYKLPLGEPYGGPLFFTHYTFLGLDPRNLQDIYANYWEQNVNQSLINWSYCKDNPHNYIGYGSQSWGLTACDNPWGYSAHSPTNDLGVIAPTAAVSALPYTPAQSMDAIKHFYYILGDHLWGQYGFYDAFDVMEGWWADSYLAIDQGPIVCMIENYRTGKLWNLFMSDSKIEQGLNKLGFTH